MDFAKVEGLGNDFLLLDWRHRSLAEVHASLGELTAGAPRICDRRLGVGGDGLLVVTAPTTPGARAAMIVINYDGSRPEMCGNGLRCVAAHVADRGDTSVIVDTDAGTKMCRILTRTVDQGAMVEVDMGAAVDEGLCTPGAAAGRSFRRMHTGNPHAVTFVGPTEDPRALALTLGPSIETDALFPSRTNVEFARVEANGAVTLFVWERGAGLTAACGTGACATAMAAHIEGRLGEHQSVVTVRLPGGPLTITLPETVQAPVRMCGPARRVFDGRLDWA